MQDTQKTWVWSLGWEDPLEKETATNFSILAWKIPSTEEPVRLQLLGLQSSHTYIHMVSYVGWFPNDKLNL